MSKVKIGAAIAAFMTAVAAHAVAWADVPVVGAPKPWQLGFQTAASPVKAQLEQFHDLLLVIITAITIFVLGLLAFVVIRFNRRVNPTPSQTSHNTLLEVIWTAVPVIILILIAVPSLRLLYFADRTHNAELTVKVVGHQWYWSYEYPDHAGVGFDSRLIPEEELKPGQLRLLEVDNRLVLPVDTDIRILVTADDVIHALAMPSLALKTDAVPGRLNETWTRIDREGVYYGQCSEICGTGHGFMPIAIEAVSKERFAEWIASRKTAATGSGAVAAAHR